MGDGAAVDSEPYFLEGQLQLPLDWGHVHADITSEVMHLARCYGVRVTRPFRFRASPYFQNPEVGVVISANFNLNGDGEAVSIVGYTAKDITILHELLHIQHPDWDEYTVEVVAQVLCLAGRVQ